MITLHRISAAASLTLLLAACSSPTPQPDVGTTPSAPAPAESGPTDSVQVDSGKTMPGDTGATPEAPASPTVTSGPAPDDPACLIGQWILTESDMQQFYDSIDAPITFTVHGNTGLEFTADAFEYTPGFTLDIDINGMGASGTLTGSIAGSYVADAGIITTSNEENDIDLIVQVGSTTMDSSDLGEGFIMSAPINSANFACGANGPIITWQNAGEGIDIELTRAG